ncbi:MAG: 1-acyl-sn-glycerol-3-phosphate acyltransferase [Oscillospiraceae bacterium]|nr:1-acyl-sn-glycerol-3-phosphate acyltransferase [Oscillospiraceae bacterium]MBQ9960058.1 1-acyl-sn-glycerol-3-phosphate acyltransferase [Oscillospiraceae bacterium]
MNDDKKAKPKSNTVPPPNKLLYSIALPIFRFGMRLLMGLRIDRSGIKNLKGPFFVVYNHTMLVDFGIVACCCAPHKLNFVVSTHFFHSKVLGPLLRIMNCIPKRPFIAHLASVRQMMRVIKRGGAVAIAPEGQISCSGTASEIDPAIGQLAKTLGVQVVNVKIRGNYLARPKWNKGNLYPARMEGKAELLLTNEQVQQMSADEIADVITQALQFDEYEWARANGVATRKKRTVEGLENVCVICPVCREMHTMRTEGDRIWCEECGYSVRTDKMGILHGERGEQAVFDTPSAWYMWQEDELRDRLYAGTLLPLHSKCKFVESGVGAYDEGGYAWTGEGEVTLDESGLHYVGTRSGEPFSYDVSPLVQRTLPHSGSVWVMEAVGNVGDERDFGFAPLDSREMMPYVQTWSLLREKLREADPSQSEV